MKQTTTGFHPLGSRTVLSLRSVRTMTMHITFSHGHSWAVKQHSSLQLWGYRSRATAQSIPQINSFLICCSQPSPDVSSTEQRTHFKGKAFMHRSLAVHPETGKGWIFSNQLFYSIHPSGSSLLLVCLGSQHGAPLQVKFKLFLTGMFSHPHFMTVIFTLIWQLIWQLSSRNSNHQVHYPNLFLTYEQSRYLMTLPPQSSVSSWPHSCQVTNSL